MKIILASGSPRRTQILSLAGIPHEVVVSSADETIDETMPPDEQVKELAARKMRAVDFVLNDKNAIIIAADTLVYIDGKVLGKPRDYHEAFEMLKTLSGRVHTVYTGVSIRHGTAYTFADAAKVEFHPLSDAEIDAYIATGEPFDKAGAYGVQERGAVLVKKIDGDFYTVVGLPISRVYRYLVEKGLV